MDQFKNFTLVRHHPNIIYIPTGGRTQSGTATYLESIYTLCKEKYPEYPVILIAVPE